MVLSEYKEIVGTAASITTIGQQFAPAFICLRIIQNGNTKDISSAPFVGGLILCSLLVQYGLMLNDSVMINVNIFGLILNSIYFSIYYIFTKDKNRLLMSSSKAFGLVTIILGYVHIGSSPSIEFYLGLTITFIMFYFIAFPLFSLKEIIETKSTATLPFPLILSGTVVTLLWLLYGIIIENIFLQIQNVVAFLLLAFQLALFAVYPHTPPKTSVTNRKTD